MESWGPLIAVVLVCALLAGALGSNKQMGGGAGFALGLLFGPLGLLIVAVSGSKSKLDHVQARPETAGWHPDPLGRFDSRYFDGSRWTQHVGRVEGGERRPTEDPL